MDLDPIPDDQQAAVQLPLQMLEEFHAVVFIQRAGPNPAEQVPSGSKAAHDAQVGVRLITRSWGRTPRGA